MMLWQFSALDCHALPGASESHGYQGQTTVWNCLWRTTRLLWYLVVQYIEGVAAYACTHSKILHPLLRASENGEFVNWGKHRPEETIKSFSWTKLSLALHCLMGLRNPLCFHKKDGLRVSFSDRSSASIPSSQWRPWTLHSAGCLWILLFKFILVFIFGS